jgi:hypothetical protein
MYETPADSSLENSFDARIWHDFYTLFTCDIPRFHMMKEHCASQDPLQGYRGRW